MVSSSDEDVRELGAQFLEIRETGNEAGGVAFGQVASDNEDISCWEV